MLRKLRSYIRQQHVGLLALFVALGGSAYAAATINSQSVVDNSLTGADIQGRNASPGKPFTQGTLTGQDVRGSAAAPGRPAVNGSLTGADIGNGSLTGADVAGGSLNGGHIAANSLTGAHILDNTLTGADVFGKSITGANIADNTLTGAHIADKSLGGGKLADNTLTGAQIDESSLGSVPQAGNAALLGGLPAGAFGTAVRTGAEQSSACGVPNTNIECAIVAVRVPEGRTYDVIVWSSISAYHSETGSKAVLFCPSARESGTPLRCLTSSSGYEDGINLTPNHSESGAAFGTTTLHAGDWIFSTRIQLSFGGGSLAPAATQQVHTTVLLFDSAAPDLPVDPPTSSGSSGTSGQSSGGSSGASGGTSGGTSGQSSSSGSSGESSSSGGSSGASGGTSGG